MALPSHVLDNLTKIGNDVLIFANLGNGVLKKRLFQGGSTTVTSCAGNESCPSGSFDATVLTTPNKLAFGGFVANSPMYTAKEGEISIGEAGTLADLICLPDPANDFLICYDSAFNPQHGNRFRAVPRKYNSADHYVTQRTENSLTISDMYVHNHTGLRSLNGRRCTIIAKVYPKGGGQIQETIYFSNVLLNMNLIQTQSDGNANIEISASGNFSITAVFSGDPS